jgi:hypothetical protein
MTIGDKGFLRRPAVAGWERPRKPKRQCCPPLSPRSLFHMKTSRIHPVSDVTNAEHVRQFPFLTFLTSGSSRRAYVRCQQIPSATFTEAIEQAVWYSTEGGSPTKAFAESLGRQFREVMERCLVEHRPLCELQKE